MNEIDDQESLTLRALCVGIDGEYIHLENNRYAVSDAVALHSSLQVHCGYISQCIKPKVVSEFWSALDATVQQARAGDTVLVYFACHGVEIPLTREAGRGMSQQLLLFPQCDPAEVVGRRELASECVPVLAMLDHVMRAARKVNWVFVIDACRSIPEGMNELMPPRHDTQGTVMFRNAGLRRVAPIASVESNENWTLIQACGPDKRAAEIERLQRGVLGYSLQRALEDGAQGGVAIWADEMLCRVLQKLMEAALLTINSEDGQVIDKRLATPPAQLLRASPVPKPLPPPALSKRTLWPITGLLGLLIVIIAVLLWLLESPTPPPECHAPAVCTVPDPLPPETCSKCPVCVACKPLEPPLCDPKTPNAPPD